jgi:hypothetical protein
MKIFGLPWWLVLGGVGAAAYVATK